MFGNILVDFLRIEFVGYLDEFYAIKWTLTFIMIDCFKYFNYKIENKCENSTIYIIDTNSIWSKRILPKHFSINNTVIWIGLIIRLLQGTDHLNVIVIVRLVQIILFYTIDIIIIGLIRYAISNTQFPIQSALNFMWFVPRASMLLNILWRHTVKTPNEW